MDKRHGAVRLTACDQQATQLGLRPGLSLTDARARVPLLRVEAVNESADAAFLRDLAACCEILTPLTALDGQDGLLLDITGCAHLFGGEEKLREQALRKFSGLGLSARATISSTPDSARALARFSAVAIASPGDEEKAARLLPVTALDAGTETTVALTRAGLKTLCDLARRPSKTLSARFGMELVTKLNRILGREDIRLTPLRPAPDCTAGQHFPEPLAATESLLAVLENLAREIGVSLEQRGLGGRVFEAVFFRADGGMRRLRIETARPSRDAMSLLRLIRLKIEALADPLDPGFGFDAIRFSVLHSESLSEHQQRLDDRQEHGGAFTDLIDQLIVRFGRDRVERFVARDTHDPIRAAISVPVLPDIMSAPGPGPEHDTPPTRPLTLFQPPQPIEALAEVPDGPPLRFRWRRVLHEVTRAEGPERIAPEWWRVRPEMPGRDYYRIEDAKGHRFWVFREGFYDRGNDKPRWFLHGLFA